MMFTRLRTYFSFVRFSHSLFALPFALAGALLASRHAPITAGTLGWILVAMVSARSAAMGFNRLVDARMDALNPRTSNRELPRGAMSMREAVLFVTVASACFCVTPFFATRMLTRSDLSTCVPPDVDQRSRITVDLELMLAMIESTLQESYGFSTLSGDS